MSFVFLIQNTYIDNVKFYSKKNRTNYLLDKLLIIYIKS